MKNNIPACPSHLVPKGNMIWVSLLTLVRNLTTIFNFQELLPVLIILSSWYPFRYFFLMQYPLEFFLCRHRFDVIIFLLLILSNFSASQTLCVCLCVLCILLSPLCCRSDLSLFVHIDRNEDFGGSSPGCWGRP